MAFEARRPGAAPVEARADWVRLAGMMALFFLVVCAVGILRPIKNVLALDGLAATEFYKVYLVSAAVVAFVPIFNRLADRMPWRWVIPTVALFFAANLVIFRFVYREGSTAFGLVFYGWYDLFAAALVTQFFMATQLFFNARSAKAAYPVVIAGGSIGATLGGAITGFFAESVGTPNLLLVAAALIVVFSAGMPLIWGPDAPRPRTRTHAERTSSLAAELRTVFGNRQVQLIAIAVLLTVLVKQLVDFQFNALTKEVFVDRDAMSAFQGKFNAATQWLPIVVLVALRPLLGRYGVGLAVLLLPVFLLASSVGMAIWFGLWAAVIAKGGETSFRYSAERAGREILYVPVPDTIKLRAKAYIDVAVEKGIGKVASALLIMVLLAVMPFRQITYVTIGLSVLWIALALAVRREYVRTLARSIESRVASVQGVFASLGDASSRAALQRALGSSDPLQADFALDLLEQMPDDAARPLAPDAIALLGHPHEELRLRAARVAARFPADASAPLLRSRLTDPDNRVRAAALQALLAGTPEGDVLIRELLADPDIRVRTTALAQLAASGSAERTRLVGRQYIEARLQGTSLPDADTREELALAAAALPADEAAQRFLLPYLEDEDMRVRCVAIHSAGVLGRADLYPQLVAALALPATRAAAREALIMQGAAAIPPLSAALLDERAPGALRRAVPGVLARIPEQDTVDALLRLVLAPETDQLLDHRAIKALSKLRTKHSELRFGAGLVREVLAREVSTAARYRAAAAMPYGESSAAELLRRALREAWRERRDGAFRCLGLLHPPEPVYRAYLAVANGSGTARANALEWLEQTLGHEGLRQLGPILDAVPSAGEAGDAARLLDELRDDGDSWVARLARFLRPDTPELVREADMQLIEKVFLLREVDLMREVRSAHLALLASIAEVIEAAPGDTPVREGEPTPALSIVVEGEVELGGIGDNVLLEPGQAFGTWALIDDAPSVVHARVTRPTRLLQITREDFHDLLADHPELAQGLLAGLAKRVRSLVA